MDVRDVQKVTWSPSQFGLGNIQIYSVWPSRKLLQNSSIFYLGRSSFVSFYSFPGWRNTQVCFACSTKDSSNRCIHMNFGFLCASQRTGSFNMQPLRYFHKLPRLGYLHFERWGLVSDTCFWQGALNLEHNAVNCTGRCRVQLACLSTAPRQPSRIVLYSWLYPAWL